MSALLWAWAQGAVVGGLSPWEDGVWFIQCRCLGSVDAAGQMMVVFLVCGAYPGALLLLAGTLCPAATR